MSNARGPATLAMVAALAGAGCSQEHATSAPRILEQTVALTPAIVPLTIGPLRGELSDVSVRRRVEESSERLDPGTGISHSLDVPSPGTAFEGGLSRLQVDLDYLPMPYREGTVRVGMTVGPRR